MSKMKNIVMLTAGILIGSLLSNPVAQAATEYLTAITSTQKFSLDGEQIYLEAYAINGNNYVKLRDVAALVDFGVTYNVGNNSVDINPDSSYVPEEAATQEKKESQQTNESQQQTSSGTVTDHSLQADPDIFSGSFTKEAYNGIREAILGGEREFMVADETGYWELSDVVSALGCYPAYSIKTDRNDISTCTVKYPTAYVEAAAYTEDFIDGIADLPQKEQVRQIVFYVCDRLTYDAGSTATPRTVLSSDAVQKGNCMSYAYSVMVLCQQAGIPCVFVHSETHQWNQVYVDGRWQNVDASAKDVGDTTEFRDKQQILLDDPQLQGSAYKVEEPEKLMQAKELLVPNSTK